MSGARGRLRLQIVHAIPGRMRFRVRGPLPPEVLQGHLAAALAPVAPGFSLSYSPHTGRFLLLYDRRAPAAAAIERALAEPPPRDRWKALAAWTPHASPLRSAAELIVPQVVGFFLVRWLTPVWLRPFTTAWRVWPFLKHGFSELVAGRLSTAVLDGAAIAASLAQRDLATASTIAFLLELGESLRQWTQEQAKASIGALFRGVDEPAWVLRDGVERQVAAASLAAGDLVVVRLGARIPVDGIVVSGEAMVNQSSMTGEAIPRAKRPGVTVFAGTVVEAGQLTVRAERVGEQTRTAAIARIIDAAEADRAEVAGEAERLAGRTVPFIFLTSGLVWLLTRNWARAASVLVVDFSCALKLATPLALKSAMLEGAGRGIVIKGGRHLETLARADAFLFDKTGTLTHARPTVAGVHPVNGFERDFVLRNAACLEEHFPHPVATAIVQQAQREDLRHEERHSKVEYIVAHGIASTLDGKRVVVGSRHFVAEDERVDISAADAIVARIAEQGQSALFFAYGGTLAGVLAIDDALVEEAGEVVAHLRGLGIRHLAMVTGDNGSAARRIGAMVGISAIHAEVLPDEKTAILRRLQAEGRTVAMLGDGINDAAALALADVGVSLRHGADIAREAADVLLLEGGLPLLVDAVRLSRLALERVRNTFTFSLSVNGALIALGLLGFAPAALLAVLHNTSTVVSCVRSLRPFLEPSRPTEGQATDVPDATHG